MLRFYKLKIKNVEKETADATILTLEIPEFQKEAFRWQPGQHLTFKKISEGEEIRRSYSIMSPIKDDEMQVLIKRVEGGKFSEPAQTDYSVGQTIEVMPPSGHFSLIAHDNKHYVFFAAGSGITPIMGMMHEILSNSNSRINLYYGNSTVESTLLKNMLTDLKDQYAERLSISYFLSQEPIDVPLFSGRIDKDKVERIYASQLQHINVAGYYLCGPGGMIDVVTQTLLDKGITSECIHSEQFLSEGQVITSKQKTSKLDSGVMVTIDGVTTRYEIKQGDQKTLLDAALESNIKMPYSCKAGVCATCRCKLREGEVDMVNNYSLEDWELEKNYILTCQSVPKTAKISIDFDA